MKVLVIGSGGREHAICWKLKQSKNVSKLYCAPCNAGIADVAECVNIKADDVEGLIKFVKENEIDFTVVGPEIPLALGIVDEFEKNRLKVFGPGKKAARLENSKVFAKEFMKKYGIPTAKFERFSSDEKINALAYIASSKFPLVIKADGLAAGKGVVICNDEDEAKETLREFFDERIFGSSGEKIVIEEFLEGDELSIFAICDGKNYVVLPPSQDHKKILDGELGKNTGGMGSFAPALKIGTDELLGKINKLIIEPVLKHMADEGNEFRGCLYCGLMIDKNGEPFVIEFNTRFGDPETQVVLPLIKSDFFELLIASAEERIKEYKLEVFNEFYCCVVLASGGYPDKYETGKEISGLDILSEGCVVYHAGTKSGEAGKILSNGGRVLNVVSKGNNLQDAVNAVYINVEKIIFENKYYRKDIGQKGL